MNAILSSNRAYLSKKNYMCVLLFHLNVLDLSLGAQALTFLPCAFAFPVRLFAWPWMVHILDVSVLESRELFFSLRSPDHTLPLPCPSLWRDNVAEELRSCVVPISSSDHHAPRSCCDPTTKGCHVISPPSLHHARCQSNECVADKERQRCWVRFNGTPKGELQFDESFRITRTIKSTRSRGK